MVILPSAADDRHAHGVACLVLVHDGVDVLRVFNFLAIDGDNQIAAQHDGRIAHVGLLVAAAQAGAIGGSAGNHPLDQNAGIGREAHLLGQVGTDGKGDNAQRQAGWDARSA